MPELNITPEQGADTPEHIQAMANKADGKTTEKAPEGQPEEKQEGTTERPAWLPEKFATPEDMARAYAEMEKKQGAGADEKTDEKTDDATPEETDEAAKEAVKAAGLDMNALGEKIATNGDLEDADYEALQKQGISREMVQNYVNGQKAVAEKMVNDMHQTVGGEEEFNALLGWASENLSADEIEAFNSTVDKGTPASIKLALQGLNSRYRSEGGASPRLVGGKRGNNATGDVFRSAQELSAAMADPRYARDPAYRADVVAKLSRSNVM